MIHYIIPVLELLDELLRLFLQFGDEILAQQFGEGFQCLHRQMQPFRDQLAQSRQRLRRLAHHADSRSQGLVIEIIHAGETGLEHFLGLGLQRLVDRIQLFLERRFGRRQIRRSSKRLWRRNFIETEASHGAGRNHFRRGDRARQLVQPLGDRFQIVGRRSFGCLAHGPTSHNQRSGNFQIRQGASQNLSAGALAFRRRRAFNTRIESHTRHSNSSPRVEISSSSQLLSGVGDIRLISAVQRTAQAIERRGDAPQPTGQICPEFIIVGHGHLLLSRKRLH